MIDKSVIQATSSWPFVEARKLIKERKKIFEKKGKIILQTGYGPSGLPHIGTFGEVVRTTMVQNALLKSQIAKIVLFFRLACAAGDWDSSELALLDPGAPRALTFKPGEVDARTDGAGQGHVAPRPRTSPKWSRVCEKKCVVDADGLCDGSRSSSAFTCSLKRRTRPVAPAELHLLPLREGAAAGHAKKKKWRCE